MGYLLQENGSKILQENGGAILIEFKGAPGAMSVNTHYWGAVLSFILFFLQSKISILKLFTPKT